MKSTIGIYASLLLFGLSVCVSPIAAAQSTQAAKQAKVDYVKIQSRQHHWACKSYATRDAQSLMHKITLKETTGYGVNAAIVSTAKIEGRDYSSRVSMDGWLAVSQGGVPTLYLDKENFYKADPLPNGMTWSRPNNTRLHLKIVPDTFTKGKAKYALNGTLSSSHGTQDLTCILMN